MLIELVLGGIFLKINITKKQYAFLAEMCLLGAYVVEESKILDNEEYNEVLKYILSFGDELGYRIGENALEGLDEIASTVINEVEFKGDFLSNYNEKVFWRELALRMAARDSLDILGEDVNSSNYQEYVNIIKNLENKYFSKFQISNYSNKELPY